MPTRTVFLALLFLLSLTAGVAQQPATEKSIYVVTIIDVLPPQAGLSPIDALLRQFAADSRKDPGCTRIDVVRQQGRPNHFMLLSVWRKSQTDFDDHTAAAHTRAFREKLQPLLGSPFDERLHEAVE